MNQDHRHTGHFSGQRRLALVSESGMGHSFLPENLSEQIDSRRILLVGNEQQFRICLSRMLADEGFDVTTTISGTDAIFLCDQKSYPLIITDIALADMTGIELLKAIKAMDQDVLVIVTSNYASIDSVLGALRADAYDYLVKPAESPSQVLATVRRAVHRIGMLWENERLIKKLQSKTKALEKANTLLKHFAINDGLTGLYNRRHFQDCLSSEIDRCERYGEYFALLFLDLDNFKIYNDANGHVEGDLLLQTLAHLFSRAFRNTDTVARYGGDEFAVILPKTTLAQALQLGETVSRQVAEYPFGGSACMPEKKITISIGCAAYPHDGNTDDELLRSADHGLYKIKNSGRGQVA